MAETQRPGSILQGLANADLAARLRSLARSLRHLPFWLKITATALGGVSAVLAILQFFGIGPLPKAQTPEAIAKLHCEQELRLAGAEASRCSAAMAASLAVALNQGSAKLKSAVDLLDAGKESEARALLQNIAQTKEGGAAGDRAEAADAFAFLGSLDYQTNPQAALAAYSNAVRLNPHDLLAWLSLGDLRGRLGRSAEAETAYQTAASLARELGDAAVEANAWLALGRMEIDRRRLSLVARYASDAMRLFEAIGDKRGIAATLGLRAQLAIENASYDSAADLLRQQNRLASELEDPYLALDAESLLGIAYHSAGKLEEAEPHVKRALAEARRLGNPIKEASMLATLAQIEEESGRLADARGHYEGALALFRQIQDRIGEAHAKGDLGELLVTMNEPQRAAELLRESAADYEAIGLPGSAARFHMSAADLYALHPELGSEVWALSAALEDARAVGDAAIGAEAGVRLATINLQSKNLGAAESYFRDAYSAAQTAGDQVNLAAALFGIGALTAANGDKELGCRQIRDAVGMVSELDAAKLADLKTRAAYFGCVIPESSVGAAPSGQAPALARP